MTSDAGEVVISCNYIDMVGGIKVLKVSCSGYIEVVILRVREGIYGAKGPKLIVVKRNAGHGLCICMSAFLREGVGVCYVKI